MKQEAQRLLCDRCTVAECAVLYTGLTTTVLEARQLPLARFSGSSKVNVTWPDVESGTIEDQPGSTTPFCP